MAIASAIVQKDEREDRAAPRRRVHPGASAVCLHDLRHDGETQAGVGESSL
jgi:hypothetical protein